MLTSGVDVGSIEAAMVRIQFASTEALTSGIVLSSGAALGDTKTAAPGKVETSGVIFDSADA